MLDFFRKLLPNFEKRRLVSQYDNTVQTANDIVLNVLTAIQTQRAEGVTNVLHSSDYATTRFVKPITKRLLGQLNNTEMKEFETILIAITGRMLTKLTQLRSYIDKLFGNQISSETLTFKQVEIIRLLDLAGFYNRFTSKMIHYCLYEHSVKTGIKIDCPLTPGEVKWLNENISAYLNLCVIFAMKDAQFVDIINKTSDLEIKEANDNVEVLGTAADPLRLGFMPGVGSAILFVQNLYLEFEVKKYEAAKLRLQSVQLQLQLLKQKAENNPEDEAIKRQIDYQTNRIKELEATIHKFEEKAGV